MIKGIAKIVVVAIVAAIIGVFADEVCWLIFVTRPLFLKYNLDQNPVYVTEKTETTIQENTALKNAIEKVQNTVVSIQSTTAKGAVYHETGLILASDGMVVALSDAIPIGAATVVSVGAEKPQFEIVKRDKTTNLALLKLAANNLVTTSFYPQDTFELGERIFLFGAPAGNPFVNEGIVRRISDTAIETDMIDTAEADGCPVFDIEGNIMGLARVAKDGRVSILPVSQIRTFSGL